MEKYILKILIFVFLCGCLIACKETKSLTEVAQLSPKNKEAYLLSKTSLERLIIMQEGLFTLYTPSREEALILKSGDSLMLFSQQFGDVNKDGHWLYQKMYMSSFSEEPLSVSFLKFSKISRDSFLVEQFTSTDERHKTLDQNFEMLSEIDVKKLKSDNCNIIFKKTGQLNFEGQTEICTIMHKGGAEQITSNFYQIASDGFNVRTNHYKKEGGKNVYDSYGDAYFNYNVDFVFEKYNERKK